MRYVVIAALGLSLGACQTAPQAGEVRFKTVTVVKRGPCPSNDVYKALKDGRPVALRHTPMPDKAAVRVAKQAAQLGIYEGEGGWGDRVMLALSRCQTEGVDP